eukprot:TRINITY_DN11358_c0_g7_i1.p1 TRINITY_DN11358_c0_g7~~TRINITY_DN11358_c0_g7_i1.p1  ORF type:complete len:298 (+),score=56.35 TRINITY_DN11358_c0_g7_i1:75-896(+)
MALCAVTQLSQCPGRVLLGGAACALCIGCWVRRGRRRREPDSPPAGGRSAGVLVDDSGHLLKPVRDAAAEREAAALGQLMRTSLRPFLPHFYGVLELDGIRYINVHNVAHGLRTPNAMFDVVIGPPADVQYAVSGDVAVTSTTGTAALAVRSFAQGNFYYNAKSPEPFASCLKRFFAGAGHNEEQWFDLRLSEIEGLLRAGIGGRIGMCAIFAAREMEKPGFECRRELVLTRPSDFQPCDGGDAVLAEGVGLLRAELAKCAAERTRARRSATP